MPWHDEAVICLLKQNMTPSSFTRPPAISKLRMISLFHAQQACEKRLKALLAEDGIAYRRTHDLQELCDLLTDHNIAVPFRLEDILEWLPFAVLYRHDDIQMVLPISRDEQANQSGTWSPFAKVLSFNLF